MRIDSNRNRWQHLAAAAGALVLLGQSTLALAVVPVVKTVPWVATNPLIPHDTWSGKQITLKGTCEQCAAFNYSWDFGDGSPVANGVVGDPYAVEATHTYVGNAGDIFTARLTVTDPGTGDSANATYFVQILDQTLPVEVNVAIDEGLWYLHKRMSRFTCGTAPLACGTWEGIGLPTATPEPMIDPVNATAFLVNGHSEGGAASNPYTETVQRAMRRVFEELEVVNLSVQNTPAGSFNPDTNGNNIGLEARDVDPPYQGGSFIDAIVATGTPAAVTQTGIAQVIGRTYADVAQDMVDAYAFGQTDGTGSAVHGGWVYSWYNNSGNGTTDNSANQWAVIGMLAAERNFGLTIPAQVKTNNVAGTINTTQAANGSFGYRDTSPIWGPYAVTPSGMVQMAFNGIGRGDNRWDRAENFMRTNFCNGGGAASAVRDYYYGLFSFTKSMLLHDVNGDGVAEPIDDLECRGSSPCGLADIDWYAAQTTDGDQCDGVARTLVSEQNAAGYWNGNNYTSSQYAFETAWAIIMLNRTVFESGLPVAACEIKPNPSVAGQLVTLDGTGSFHQDPASSIVTWEWDVDDDGVFDFSGPLVNNVSLPPIVAQYPITLRVTDDATPPLTDETICIADVNTPPIAPTADAGGPYVFCPVSQPWFIDGSASINPDEGVSEPGQPGDTIQAYEWDLDGDGQFDDAAGVQPDVTAYFTGQGPGDYLVQLRVTDTTATSFPSSGFGDLSDTNSAQVSVKDALDPACDCIDNVAARPKRGKVQLTWTDSGAPQYKVYRSTTAGGPYGLIGITSSDYSTFLDANVVNGTTYHYVVRPAGFDLAELCQSNEASATPGGR